MSKNKEQNDDTAPNVEPSDDRIVQGNQDEQTVVVGKGSLAARLKSRLFRRKVIIPLAILLPVAIALALPLSRYKVLGLFISRDFSVTVLDSTTENPISGAEVSLAGRSIETDSKGKALVKDVKVGQYDLKITKKYFEGYTKNVLVGLDDGNNSQDAALIATGRQVPVVVKDKISGEPVEGAVLSALSTNTETDKNGEAVLVVPAGQEKLDVTIKKNDYNEKSGKLVVTEKATPENTFSITPAGRLYFLSKKSGKLDIVSTNLDGSGRKTVLAGTGEETDYDTYLEASGDWKYLALKARRDSEKAKLYLIEAGTGKLTVMDEGDADFAPIGWHGHEFVYEVSRQKKEWEPKQEAIKSYDADKLDITTMQESAAGGDSQWNYARQYFNNFILTNEGLVYTSSWWGDGWGVWKAGQGRKTGIYLAEVGTQEKSTIKAFDRTKATSIDAIERKPNEIDIQVYINSSDKFFKYKNGQVAPTEMNTNEFYFGANRTYYVSPSGNKTFWHENRDGKNTLLIGDKNAENAKDILSLSEYQSFGWYTDDYLLVTKSGSELHIMVNEKSAKPVKISDFSSGREKNYYH